MTEAEAREALKTVLDPEIGIDIVNLGLIEDLAVEPGAVHLRMIMTSLACPLHGHLATQAEAALRKVVGAKTLVRVEILEKPAWTPARMSADARRKLGW